MGRIKKKEIKTRKYPLHRKTDFKKQFKIFQPYQLFALLLHICFFSIYISQFPSTIPNMSQAQTSKNIQLLSIEGNIGNGKSTLLRKLSEDAEMSTLFYPLYEPLQEWLNMKDEHGRNLLQIYYDEKERWSYTMQTFAFLTKMRSIKRVMENSKTNFDMNVNTPSIILAERSIMTDYHIFAKSCYQSQKMNTLEWNIYRDWFNWAYEEYIRSYSNNIQPKFIYLRLDPETSFQRIHKRSRNEEKSIPMEYLQHLHELHEEWLLAPELRDNVCIIDASVDFENDEAQFQRVRDTIRTFLNI